MKEITIGSDFYFSENYEIRYGRYLDFFKTIAESKTLVRVLGTVPNCWIGLINYLGGVVTSNSSIFPQCNMFDINYISGSLTRLDVEITCATRPELVDALWKADCEWKTGALSFKKQSGEIPITTYSAFYRKEYLDFMTCVQSYVARKKGVVFVPCSAIKPYPSSVHTKVLELLKNTGFELVVVSGALGPVPKPFWKSMPLYDAGLPNERRVEKSVRLFSRKYKNIICYSDFNGNAISKALIPIQENQTVEFPLGIFKTANYLSLDSEKYLKKLRSSLNAFI